MGDENPARAQSDRALWPTDPLGRVVGVGEVFAGRYELLDPIDEEGRQHVEVDLAPRAAGAPGFWVPTIRPRGRLTVSASSARAAETARIAFA